MCHCLSFLCVSLTWAFFKLSSPAAIKGSTFAIACLPYPGLVNAQHCLWGVTLSMLLKGRINPAAILRLVRSLHNASARSVRADLVIRPLSPGTAAAQGGLVCQGSGPSESATAIGLPDVPHLQCVRASHEAFTLPKQSTCGMLCHTQVLLGPM